MDEDKNILTASSSKVTLNDVAKPVKIKKEPKSRQKTKIRHLVKSEKKKNSDENSNNIKNPSKSKKLWKIIFISVIVAVLAVIVSNISVSSCGFWATYENNFNKIVYGDEKFCYRELDPVPTISKLRTLVASQDDAITLIEGSLGLVIRERIIQMAFFGQSGVGKTWTSIIMMEEFKWKKNVISLIFEESFQQNLTSEEAFASDFKQVNPLLNECGFNLLVIDDVPALTDTIQRVNELERNLHRLAKQKIFKIILVVIFNGSELSLIEEHLKNFVIIEFQAFTEVSLRNCIKVHETIHNVKLKPKEIEELMMINYASHGCKTVVKKLNLLGEK